MSTPKRIRPKLSKEEAFSFLLTHIVVERNYIFEMNPPNLFKLTHMAAEAVAVIEQAEDRIPHEVIENIALGFDPS